MRIFVLAVLCLAGSPAFAQDQPVTSGASDTRWLPWLGCWRPSEQRAPEEGAHICVVPDRDGVRTITLAGDRTVVEEQVIADGVERTINEPACSGRRRAEWSRDGERFFSTAELTCENDRRERSPA